MGRKRRRGRPKGLKFPRGYSKRKPKSKRGLRFGGFRRVQINQRGHLYGYVPIYVPKKTDRISKSRKVWRR